MLSRSWTVLAAVALATAVSLRLEGLCSQTEARWFYWGWSLVYDEMQPYFTSDEMREAGLDMADLVKAGPLNVLDVGAGTGTLSRQVLRRVPTAKLTLLDLSPEMLERAKAKPELAPCSFVLSDAESLPFDDSSFDRVVSSGTLYYYPRPVVALREQLRVVKPGGHVLAMGSLAPKPMLVRLLAQTFNRFPTEEQYVQWFEAAGLSNVRTRYISNPWNAAQYALAIAGTKAAGTASPPRSLPPPPTLQSRLRELAYLPVAAIRFAVAIIAFAVIGPIQVLTARRGMMQLAANQTGS